MFFCIIYTYNMPSPTNVHVHVWSIVYICKYCVCPHGPYGLFLFWNNTISIYVNGLWLTWQMTMISIAYLVLNVRGHRIHIINNTLCLIFYIYIYTSRILNTFIYKFVLCWCKICFFVFDWLENTVRVQ